MYSIFFFDNWYYLLKRLQYHLLILDYRKEESLLGRMMFLSAEENVKVTCRATSLLWKFMSRSKDADGNVNYNIISRSWQPFAIQLYPSIYEVEPDQKSCFAHRGWHQCQLPQKSDTSCTCVTWIIRMCDVTYSHAQHDSCLHATLIICTYDSVCEVSLATSTAARKPVLHLYVRHLLLYGSNCYILFWCGCWS